MTKKSHLFCGFCGSGYQELVWPRTCTSCKETTWRNPVPVAVVLLEVQPGSVLLIKRGIEPKIGQWALPGGFIEHGETLQEGAARELREESGFDLEPHRFFLYHAASSQDKSNLLLFARARLWGFGEYDLSFRCEETLDMRLATKPEDLAFSSHTEALLKYLQDYQ